MTSPKVHLALLLANSFWGIGAVVGALGLPATNPLAFCTIRQVLAGLLLLAFAEPMKKPLVVYWKKFVFLGFAVFVSQAGFLVGTILAGPVISSVWQPSQPIFTVAICMIMGWEPVMYRRLVGVCIAFVGCLVMILLSENGEDSTSTSSSSGFKFMVGNILLLINCIGDPIFFLASKDLLKILPPLTVSGYSYLFSSVIMGLATIIIPHSFLCPDCTHGAFHIPQASLPALLYFVTFASAGSYFLITWAVQHATGTLAMSYTVLQPVSAVFVTVILLFLGMVANCTTSNKITSTCLDPPNIGTLFGMLGVFCGLFLIIKTEPTSEEGGIELDRKKTLKSKMSDV